MPGDATTATAQEVPPLPSGRYPAARMRESSHPGAGSAILSRSISKATAVRLSGLPHHSLASVDIAGADALAPWWPGPHAATTHASNPPSITIRAIAG